MIFKHELNQKKKTLLIWTAIVGGMDFIIMLMYPGFEDAIMQMNEAYSNMGALSTAFGMDKLNMAEPIGFYGSYIGAVLSLGGSLFAAVLGTGLLSKEEDGHTAEFLFTLPYSRINIIMQKLAATTLLIFIFDLVNTALGIAVFPLIDSELFLSELLLYHFSQFCMHIAIAAMGICVSAFTKHVSLGTGLGIALLMYFLDMMSRVLEQLEGAKYITPFYYANASDVICNNSIDLGLLLLSVAVTAAVLIIGGWHYNKKDLAS